MSENNTPYETDQSEAAQVFDQQRADIASAAGSEAGWAITGRPSAPRTFKNLQARAKDLQAILDLRNDAQADPLAFIKGFFEAIENELSDLEYEARNDWEQELEMATREARRTGGEQ